MITIVLCTSNHWKVEEIKETIYTEMKLSKRLINCMTLQDFIKEIDTDITIKPVQETEISYEVNATLKAISIASQMKYVAIPNYLGSVYYLAEDSGLEVDGLNLEPGVNSARYLGEKTPYSIKRRNVLERMKSITNRTACIHSAVTVAKYVSCDNIATFTSSETGK